MATAVKKLTSKEIIQALPKDYIFVKSLGTGGLGKVVKCLNRKTGEEVAIKMMHSNMDHDREAQIVEKMKEARLDSANMVKFLEQIETKIGKGLVFECLDTTFHNYTNEVFPLPLCDVRAIINQMAVALEALETYGYVHTDIKSDNIMIRGTGRPLEAKLIDFGEAIPLTETKDRMSVTPTMYRAPEVLLGCPYDAAIDVWSLGVTVICMLMDFELFPNDSEYQAIRAIVKLLGQPPDELLNQGDQTNKFFNKRGQTWKLKTRKQYAKENCVHVSIEDLEDFPSLKSLIKSYDIIHREDMEELDSCIDLLEKMLDVNKATRIRAADIGNHPFIKNYRDNIPVEKSTLPAQQMSEEQEQESTSSREGSINPYSSEEVQALLPERYAVVRMQGVDDFCDQMVKCKRKDTGKVFSVKISHIGRDTSNETCLLKRMMKKGLEKWNIAEYFETVDFGTSKALVFEELDTSLADYHHSQRKIPLMEARTITEQAATALVALQELKLIHGDLTMDSIWFTDLRQNLTKIKLVDFSSAMYSKDVQEETILLSRYRAPEIILGLPITEAVDVWSLGCISATMALGFSIFPEGDFETLKVIVALFGQPPDDILNAGTKVTHFFKKTAGSWRLMTDKEYTKSHGLLPDRTGPYYTEKFKSLEHLIKKKVNGGMCGDLYHDDYVLLLSEMFQVDAAKRIKPSQILEHYFFMDEYSDSEESEDEEEKDEPWLPPPVKAAQSEDTPRVPCITELSRVEHQLVAPETVQVFPDRIDNTLLILSPTNYLTLEEHIPLGHTVPHFHRLQPYGSGEEMGTRETGTSKRSSTETKASRSGGAISQSAARPGGSISQSASRPGGSISQSASRSGGSKSLSASRSGGSISQSASSSGGSISQSASRPGGSVSQSASRPGGSVSQSASRPGGSVSQSASRPGGSISQSATSSGGSKSLSASRSGGSISQSASSSGGSLSQSASRPGGSVSQSASRPGGSVSQSASRPGGSISQSASSSGGSLSQSASRPGGSVSQSASRPGGSVSQSASRSGGSISQSASSSGGSLSQSASRPGGSVSQSASRPGGSISQSAARSGKLEDGNSDGNDHRFPLKSLLMVKEEPEEEKKEGKKGEKKKKKNCLRRAWSWIKKSFSCWNAVDDDDRDNWRYVAS